MDDVTVPVHAAATGPFRTSAPFPPSRTDPRGAPA